MTIRIFMDGQFGSCGKGAVISSLIKHPEMLWKPIDLPVVVVRAGGPQAGHSMLGPCPLSCGGDSGHQVPVGEAGATGHVWKMRQIPVNWASGGFSLVSRGAMVSLEVLKGEIEQIEAVLGSVEARSHIRVDSAAFVVSEDDVDVENHVGFGESGSTREGVGAARASAAMRQAQTIDDLVSSGEPGLEWLHPYLHSDTTEWIRKIARDGRTVWIEGTQGFGLSLRASGNYPFVTSCDITPQQLLADVGLHWRDAPVRTTMLLRTYPIRIAGSSGPLSDIPWSDINRAPEFTTVTNKERRLGRFDWHQVARAVDECRPDELIITFLDYLPTRIDQSQFIDRVEDRYSLPVTFGSVGFEELRRREEWK